MSEERPQHPQEPAEGAEAAEDAPGVEQAGDDEGMQEEPRRGPSSIHRSRLRGPKRPRGLLVPIEPKARTS